MSIQTVQRTNGTVTIFLPLGAQELSERKLALEMSEIDDLELYAELWDDLANAYDKVYPGGVTVAQCRKRAAHYREVMATEGQYRVVGK